MTSTIQDFISQLRLEYLPHNILCLCGVVANVMLLICFIKNPLKCFRNSSTSLIASLALSDLIVSLTAPLRVYLPDNVTKISQIDAFWYISMFMIISIAADRYFMIAYPFKHRAFIKIKGTSRVLQWITFVWLVSFVPPFKKSFSPGKYDEHITNGLSLLVVIIVFILYTMTYRTLKRQEKDLRAKGASESSLDYIIQLRITKERRFFQTIAIITLFTGIALCPLALYEEVTNKRYSSYSGKDRAITCVFATTLVLNFVVNPFIYVWRLPNYRKTFLLIYCNRPVRTPPVMQDMGMSRV